MIAAKEHMTGRGLLLVVCAIVVLTATTVVAVDVVTKDEWSLAPNIFPPRQKHGAACTSDAAFIAGGVGPTGELLTDMWRYSNQQWQPIFPVWAPRLINPSLTAVDGKLYMFGGQTESGGLSNDLHVCDVANDVQRDNARFRLSARDSAIRPAWRYRHAAVGDVYRLLIMFGAGYDQLFNDMWQWSGGRWSELRSAPESPVPPGLMSPCCAILDSSVYCFGGTAMEGDSSAMWVFDTTTLMWQNLVTLGSLPAPRRLATCGIMNKHFYLFGGWDSHQSRFIDDRLFHALQLESLRWSSTDTEVGARDNHAMCRMGDTLVMTGGDSMTGGTNNDVAVTQETDSRVRLVKVPATLSPANVSTVAYTPTEVWVYDAPSKRFSVLDSTNAWRVEQAAVPPESPLKTFVGMVGEHKMVFFSDTAMKGHPSGSLQVFHLQTKNFKTHKLPSSIQTFTPCYSSILKGEVFVGGCTSTTLMAAGKLVLRDEVEDVETKLDVDYGNTPLHLVLESSSVAVYNSKIYVVGGGNRVIDIINMTRWSISVDHTSNKVTVREEPSLVIEPYSTRDFIRFESPAVTIGDYIFYCGGAISTDFAASNYRMCARWNPATGVNRLILRQPVYGSYNSFAAAAGKTLYFIGGTVITHGLKRPSVESNVVQMLANADTAETGLPLVPDDNLGGGGGGEEGTGAILAVVVVVCVVVAISVVSFALFRARGQYEDGRSHLLNYREMKDF